MNAEENLFGKKKENVSSVNVRTSFPQQSSPFYYENINKIFGNYTITEENLQEELNVSGKRIAKSFQKFVSSFINDKTPARGLLCIHGIGSGKTYTGVLTMNSNARLNVIIMSPASLRGNWEREVARSYRVLDANGNKKKVVYISHNAPNFVEQMRKLILEDYLIIIDESHLFFQNCISGSAQQAIEVYHMLEHSRRCKFLFLTGTPISGHPFEIILAFNLLKGKLYELPDKNLEIESNYIKAKQEKKEADEKRKKKPNIFEILARPFMKKEGGNIKVEVLGGTLDDIKGYGAPKNNIEDNIKKDDGDNGNLDSLANDSELKNDEGDVRLFAKGDIYKKPFDLFPISISEFTKAFISEEFNSIKNRDVFAERITGLVSYYPGVKDPERKVLPFDSGTEVIKCPMNHVLQWSGYLRARKDEARLEQIFKYKTEAFTESNYKKSKRASIGTFKINSRMANNFAFPIRVEEIMQSIPKGQNSVIDWSFIIQKHKDLAARADELPKIMLPITEMKWKLFTLMGSKDLDSLTSGSESKNDGINSIKTIEDVYKHSSKLGKLLEMLTRPEGKGKKKFMYSEFMILGTRMIAYFLQKIYGYHEIRTEADYESSNDGNGFIVIDGNTRDKDLMKELFNRTDNTRGEKISILLGTKVVSAGYDFKCIRETYIFEPQWRDITLEQVKGRAIRTGSHTVLPYEDRTVKTYIMVATNKEGGVGLPQDKGQTSDEMLYELAVAKSEFIDTFLDTIYEASVDCKINQLVHKKKIKCRVCNKMSDEPGKYEIIIPANYKEHLISGPRCSYEESLEELTDITKKDTTDSTKGMKKDSNNNVYREENGAWKEIGFIKNNHIIFNDL